MIYQNHVIDPTFFYDAIEEFSFNYVIYTVESVGLADNGREKITYSKNIIRGSLQSQGLNLVQSNKGNTQTKEYNFYCKSLYRLEIGDIIEYKNNYYRCKFVQDYDEFGVRNGTLELIKLSAYRDLKDYIDYLKGVKLV